MSVLKAPRVSVVMPVFNCEQYVEAAIASIFDQTWREFEFIIIDDGSTDRSLDIIRANIDSRVRLISRENRGLAHTLNEGISISRGDYIARMDSDDISLPARLSRQVSFLENNPHIGLVGTWAVAMTEDGHDLCVIEKPVDNEIIKHKLLLSSPFIHGSIIFRRSLFDIAGPYPEELGNFFEDWVLFRKMANYTGMSNLQVPLYKYRLRPTSNIMRTTGHQKHLTGMVNRFIQVGYLSAADRQFLLSLHGYNTSSHRLANYYLEAGLMLLEHGHNHTRSRYMLLKSLALRPVRLKAWINLAYTVFPVSFVITCKRAWKNLVASKASLLGETTSSDE